MQMTHIIAKIYSLVLWLAYLYSPPRADKMVIAAQTYLVLICSIAIHRRIATVRETTVAKLNK